MKVLIVGAGGREHALAWQAKKSSQLTGLFITPGNAGIANIGDCWGLTDIPEIVKKAQEVGVNLAIIGQEDYLADGIADALEAVGIACCGPSAKASLLEASKAVSKDFMKKYQIPTAGFGNFTTVEPALDYLKTLNAPYVIKASGLAAGKGVLILDDLEAAEAGLRSMLENDAFGQAGSEIVIEEFMHGEEASYFIFTDGNDFVSMPTLQDHKRQLNLDLGPNTGGMGCYSPAPVVTPEVEQKILDLVVVPTIEGMKKEGTPYKGVLYIGLMIENGNPRVVEYNIRFGDPEAQPLMMLLDSDLLDISMACAKGGVKDVPLRWKDAACANVVLASGGYPEAYKKGYAINGLDDLELNDEKMVFHAGTKKDGSLTVTNGGRVLGCTALGENLPMALDQAYKLVDQISWPKMQYRSDIGVKGLKNLYAEKSEQVSVGIIMGSASDMKVAQKAVDIFKEFGVNFELLVASAHRTPDRAVNFIHELEEKGAGAIIAIAGLAAHLPGVVASKTLLPVIGVPVDSNVGGLDALYSIVQMPPGIPVASVGIGRGENAALLAIQILATKDTELKRIHQEYRLKMEQKVIASQPEGY